MRDSYQKLGLEKLGTRKRESAQKIIGNTNEKEETVRYLYKETRGLGRFNRGTGGERGLQDSQLQRLFVQKKKEI